MGNVADQLLDGTSGYVSHTEFPYATPVRRYPQRTSVNIAVRMALLWPAEPANVPDYIKQKLGPQESALKQALIDRISLRIAKALEASKWNEALEAFGVNLPR